MRDYIKPFIEEEEIVLEDVIAASGTFDWDDESTDIIDPIVPKA